jgi:DeoR family glycerol-3-phosphate regulon repressor
MTPEERRQRIVSVVRDRERVSVDALAGMLDASRETIRRDLSELDALGWLRKHHGGASAVEPALSEALREGPFRERMRDALPAKRAIARTAISLFQPGDSLFIDTGTTTLVFAEELARARELTIITNSTKIAALAGRGEGNQVFLLGGRYRDDGGESLGPIAVDQARRFHAMHAVLTVGALDAAGIMDFDPEEAEIARVMTEQARDVTVLADSGKFGRSALFKVATLEAVTRLVTDAAPPRETEAALREAGVKTVLAGNREDL